MFKTRRLFFSCIPLLFFVFAVGCQGTTDNEPNSSTQKDSESQQSADVEKNLVGRWTVDADASKSKWGDRPNLARRMSEQLDMEWEFKADQTMTVYKGTRSRDRKWEVKSKEGDLISIDILADDADPNTKTVTFTFTFLENDRVVYSSSEAEGELVLTRVRE